MRDAPAGTRRFDPEILRYAIQDRKDWERIRDERLNPRTPGQAATDLDEQCRESLVTDKPVVIGIGSLYGCLRNLLGVENLSYAVYDDPAWVEEMMEHRTNLTLTVLEKIAGKARVDFGTWWIHPPYGSPGTAGCLVG